MFILLLYKILLHEDSDIRFSFLLLYYCPHWRIVSPQHSEESDTKHRGLIQWFNSFIQNLSLMKVSICGYLDTIAEITIWALHEAPCTTQSLDILISQNREACLIHTWIKREENGEIHLTLQPCFECFLPYVWEKYLCFRMLLDTDRRGSQYTVSEVRGCHIEKDIRELSIKRQNRLLHTREFIFLFPFLDRVKL